MSSVEVIVYTSTGCPYCEKVKTHLTEWGIEFEVRNVTLYKEYFEKLRENNIPGTPATYVNGKLILGFQEKKFKEALGLEEDNELDVEVSK
ncbi:glutaredoxin family protein [Anaerobacillus alkaliphilus]|uniref:Glutaredoxin family protein n=1 Tax=Anaerobacillus alkaliphilus TaxID=1548597 RepID=A0A4Q0VQ05_9BACI|nr:glutaredoxin family protein [Anaerobacillus alkaliphilus]RXI98181.1 glutaredoxin family protein [Anaerobacillus alkaliphilus]